MQTYGDFAPTPFDSAGAFLPELAAWLVAPCTENRDSDHLTRSNYAAQLAELQRLDPKDWQEHSFGHWAVGHFEIVLVRPDSAAAAAMADLEEHLEDYPVLDDGDLYERECDAACDSWASDSISGRIEMCRRAGVSIFAARRDEFPADDSNRLMELYR